MSHVQTRPDGVDDDEILQQYLELEKVIMNDSASRLADKAKKPCEQTKVDEQEQKEIKRREIEKTILVNKVKQTMRELFVKMQEADRLGLLEMMSFSSQLEAYIKILFATHTDDVLKRNPFLGDAIKHTLFDRLFLREQAYNQD